MIGIPNVKDIKSQIDIAARQIEEAEREIDLCRSEWRIAESETQKRVLETRIDQAQNLKSDAELNRENYVDELQQALKDAAYEKAQIEASEAPYEEKTELMGEVDIRYGLT